MSDSQERPNPFPQGTVVSEAGVRLGDFRGKSWSDAHDLVEVYRENYFAPKSPGLAMGIRGRFGSGKTHLAFQLRDDFAKDLVTCSVYAKIDHASFLELYKSHFAPKVLEQINTVIARHLAKLLRIQTSGTEQGESSLPAIAQKAVDEALATSPQRVLELVERDLLPVGGLSRALDSEIEASSKWALDFFRAYAKLRESAWSKTALRWFGGDILTPAERDDLGVHSVQIATTDQARRAMRFLLEVHRKADVPLLLCVDEFERFAVRGSAEDMGAFPGFLKDLAEMFDATGNAFVLCGAEEAWRRLTADTFDRIRRDRIIEVKLADGEAEKLLDVYCQNSRRKLGDVFDSGVTAFLTEMSDGNARRMLNISYQAYALTTGNRRISQQDVRVAASKVLADDQRFQTMDEAIRGAARDQNLSVTKQVTLGEFRVDYVLGETGERPTFLIVMQSSFKLDEVGSGRSAAAAAAEVRRSRDKARTAVIVLGYSTAEVRRELERVADAVLVYDEDRFAAELGDFLRTVPAPVASQEAQKALYQQALQSFTALDNKRSQDLDALSKQLAEMQAALRSQASREREERVTDKIGDAIRQFQELLQREENYAEDGLRSSPPGAPLDTQAKVLSVLDDERSLVRQLVLLNDGLPESSTIRPVLRAMSREIDDWEQKVQSLTGDLPSVRAIYRQRRETLNELELRHTRRLRREMTLLGWRVSSRYLLLAAIAAAGIVCDLVMVTVGISANRTILDAYYSHVVDARSYLSQINSAGKGPTEELLKTRGQLDRAFLSAKAAGLPVAVLTGATGAVITAIDKIGTPSQDTSPGISAADDLLSSRPSTLWVTLAAMWPWLVAGLLPTLAVMGWWLIRHLPVRRNSDPATSR